MVQISGRAGDIGKFDNVVVPAEREIRRLRPALRYFAKLKPTPFNYGTGSGYRKYPEPKEEPAEPAPLDTPDDLPLFKKL